MSILGGCFCGKIRYELTGDVLVNGMCCCKSCQNFTGGSGNPTVAIWAKDIKWLADQPASYQHSPQGATRQFCATCGTQITAQVPSAEAILTVKIGTFDDPTQYSGPHVAIWCEDKPNWLNLPDKCMAFQHGSPEMPKAF
ncbi:MAG: GFA family protein [Pseudomonadota bacterium]